MTELVKVSIENNVADVRLNRPEKHNALNYEMFKEIAETGDLLSKNFSVRAVVLSGEGSGFCSGLDFQDFMQTLKKASAEEKNVFRPDAGKIANFAQLAAHVWKTMPVPVIAAVHGVAFGGGFQIALAADIRFASFDSRFSLMEVRFGLVPDMAISQTLRPLVRIDIAKELTFSGRIVGAEEALRLGLVTKVCGNPLGEALTFAKEIAEKSPHAIRAGKRLLEETWYASEENGLRLEAELQQSLLNSSNQIEAMQANFQKRPPKFMDPE